MTKTITVLLTLIILSFADDNKTGILALDISPYDATLTLDGDTIDRSNAKLSLPEGEYVVASSHKWYHREKLVEVKAGETNVVKQRAMIFDFAASAMAYSDFSSNSGIAVMISLTMEPIHNKMIMWGEFGYSVRVPDEMYVGEFFDVHMVARTDFLLPKWGEYVQCAIGGHIGAPVARAGLQIGPSISLRFGDQRKLQTWRIAYDPGVRSWVDGEFGINHIVWAGTTWDF